MSLISKVIYEESYFIKKTADDKKGHTLGDAFKIVKRILGENTYGVINKEEQVGNCTKFMACSVTSNSKFFFEKDTTQIHGFSLKFDDNKNNTVMLKGWSHDNPIPLSPYILSDPLNSIKMENVVFRKIEWSLGYNSITITEYTGDCYPSDIGLFHNHGIYGVYNDIPWIRYLTSSKDDNLYLTDSFQRDYYDNYLVPFSKHYCTDPQATIPFGIYTTDSDVFTSYSYISLAPLNTQNPTFDWKHMKNVTWDKATIDYDKYLGFPVNWKLYIDGTKLPNYKLLWDNNRASENAVIHILGIDNDILTNTPKDTAHDENVYSLHDECKITYKEFNTLCGNLPYDEGIGAILPKSSGWLGMYMTDGNKKSSTMVIQLFPKATNPLSDGEPKLYYNPHFWNSGDDGSTLTIVDNGKTPSGEDAPDPDKDDEYENHKDEEDENLPDTANNSIGVLTSTYKMTRDRLSQLGSFLWSGNIFDSFSLVNSNPIENIISCKDIPFSIGGGADKIIKLGNVDTGVNGEKVNTNFSELTIGSITIPKRYNNFLDLAPYTKVTIYVPYIGFKELDVTQIMGKRITVKYAVDVITGGCISEIFCSNTRLYEFSGQVGIDIPITASNRAQVEAGYISNAVSSGADLITGDVLGASETMLSSAFSKYHYSSTSAPSPSCVASLNRTCYIVIDRPTYDNLSVFNHTRGRMCNLSKKIGNLRGFTICDSHVDLSGIAATDAEKNEIIKILSSGFFA